jgi:hypothetical protein
MDREMLQRHLEEAERHVAQGERHISEQEERVAELARLGADVSAQTLQEAGLIEYKRGEIRILDVSRMREAVCECYQAVNDQYAEIAAPSDH